MGLQHEGEQGQGGCRSEKPRMSANERPGCLGEVPGRDAEERKRENCGSRRARKPGFSRVSVAKELAETGSTGCAVGVLDQDDGSTGIQRASVYERSPSHSSTVPTRA
jgi:hypothetical protein